MSMPSIFRIDLMEERVRKGRKLHRALCVQMWCASNNNKQASIALQMNNRVGVGVGVGIVVLVLV